MCAGLLGPGRVGVVVGASSALGEALSRRLVCHHKMRVVCTSRRPLPWVEDVAGDAAASAPMSSSVVRGAAVHQSVDVVSPTDCDQLMRFARETYGPVDVVVNCSGVTLSKLLLRTSVEDMNHVVQTNVIGSMNVTKSAIRVGGMPGSKSVGGCIIHIGSVVGVVGNEGQVAYAASKAALTGLVKSFAKEYGSRNVRVNVIAPGLVGGTGMGLTLTDAQREAWRQKTSLQRLATADDVVDAIVGIASCSYITGQTIVVDGGLS